MQIIAPRHPQLALSHHQRWRTHQQLIPTHSLSIAKAILAPSERRFIALRTHLCFSGVSFLIPSWHGSPEPWRRAGRMVREATGIQELSAGNDSWVAYSNICWRRPRDREQTPPMKFVLFYFKNGPIFFFCWPTHVATALDLRADNACLEVEMAQTHALSRCQHYHQQAAGIASTAGASGSSTSTSTSNNSNWPIDDSIWTPVRASSVRLSFSFSLCWFLKSPHLVFWPSYCDIVNSSSSCVIPNCSKPEVGLGVWLTSKFPLFLHENASISVLTAILECSVFLSCIIFKYKIKQVFICGPK